ncbi:hypothetical protein TNCV_4468941 [Trichonephila clavipes]|nr:hypothetical protein TNCV_4468941 [Trichonephila clavipes]
MHIRNCPALGECDFKGKESTDSAIVESFYFRGKSVIVKLYIVIQKMCPSRNAGMSPKKTIPSDRQIQEGLRGLTQNGSLICPFCRCRQPPLFLRCIGYEEDSWK